MGYWGRAGGGGEKRRKVSPGVGEIGRDGVERECGVEMGDGPTLPPSIGG